MDSLYRFLAGVVLLLAIGWFVYGMAWIWYLFITWTLSHFG